MKVGKDSVVIGHTRPDLEVGDGSVVIGATDAYGNTILNQPMAVGRNAQAGPNSIAIGAGANSSGEFNLSAALHEMSEIARQANDVECVHALETMRVELSKQQPDKSTICRAWDVVKAAACINGAHTLVAKIAAVLASLL